MAEIRVIRQTVQAPVRVIRETVSAPIRVIRETVREGRPGGGASIETIAPHTVSSVVFDGSWPDRPTARPDIRIIWIGPDPSPDIVEPPSVAGMYEGDLRAAIP